MLLVKPIHRPEFLRANDLGVEMHITHDDLKENFSSYLPFVGGIHLPYSGINLAAVDKNYRQASLEKLKNSIKSALQYHIDTMVFHPCGIFSQDQQQVGEYPLLIDSLRKIADFAAAYGITLAMENQVLRHPDTRIIAACSSGEWFQLYHDIARKNVKLALDTSHAASVAAHGSSLEERHRILRGFFEHPDLIVRFHWSDARLANNEAVYNDMHLVPGQGDLPRELHKAVLQHPAVKLLEQNCTEQAVSDGLQFIRSLL